MATVSGLTKERMLAIEASCIVSGAVDLSNHLILTRQDGGTIDAGYVKGDPADLPNRLNNGGQTTSDWNLAVEPGFYTSAVGATNSPDPSKSWSGLVRVGPSGKLIQDLSNSDADAMSGVTYRRTMTAPATFTPYEPTSLVIGDDVVDCNDCVLPGQYRVLNTALNTATVTNLGLLVVYRAVDSTESFIRQEFRRVFTDATGILDRRRWVRDSYDGGATWEPWVQEFTYGFYRSSSVMALTTTAQIIPFDTITYAHPDFTYTTGGTWTCTRDGIYAISGSISVGTASAPVLVQFLFDYEGSNLYAVHGRADTLGISTVNFTNIYREFSVGESFTIEGARGSTGTVAMGNSTTRTWLSIESV
jgi:hypothetical protein